MRLAGLADPLYEQTQGSVRLTLSAEPVDRELEARLPRDTRLLIAALRDAGELSTGEVAEAVGVSRITASERLKKLRDAGLVEWTGRSPKIHARHGGFRRHEARYCKAAERTPLQ